MSHVCQDCGQRLRYVVTQAMGGWGVELVCDGCGPLCTVSMRYPTERDGEEELFALVAIETERSVEDLRRLYYKRKAERAKETA
jgi:hypothetical protein